MKMFPSTKVTWPDASDAPNSDEATIENAHVTFSGDRLTIRKRNDEGRYDVVDSLIQATWKGNGSNVTVTGKSTFMMDTIGLGADDAEVTVAIEAVNGKCLTC